MAFSAGPTWRSLTSAARLVPQHRQAGPTQPSNAQPGHRSVVGRLAVASTRPLLPVEHVACAAMPPAKARRRRRRRGPRRSPRSPAQLVEDTVGEILLRLPPDDPASLVRSSAVSKTWRRALADPTFPARYRAFHRTPPVLGVFWGDAVFVPTTSFRPPAADHSDCNVLDCRHSRVLLENLYSGGLFVWDPIICRAEAV